MTLTPPSTLHASNTHVEQPWDRLQIKGRTVGFRRYVGDATLYSKDGYGWSSTVIESEQVVSQLRRQLHRQRIFHGDIIRIAPQAGLQEYSLQIVLTDGHVDYLCDLKTRRLLHLDEAWPPPSTPRAREIVGSMYAEEPLAKVVDRAFRQITAPTVPARRQCVSLAGLIGVGLLLVSMAQLLLLGHIGPVMSSLGGLAGAIAYFWFVRRLEWHTLRRKWALGLSVRAALIHGVVWLCCVQYVRLGLIGGTGDHSALRSLALGSLGTLVALICGIIGADLVAWRTGGYAGEPSLQRSFRDSS